MFRAVILALALGFASYAQQTCPATANTSSVAFTPPAPYPEAPARGFLYGTTALWTYIDSGPMHTGDEDHLSAKLIYWRTGFDWKAESLPDLKVIAKRLDSPAPLIEAPQVRGVRLNDDEIPANMAMMTGIAFPEPGCWQIVATYKGINTLSYIAWVVR
jgi:hypothetical protein